MSDTELSISLVELFAAALAELGDAARAARLIGASDAQRLAAGLPRSEPDERHLRVSFDVARQALSDEAWNSCWKAGTVLSIGGFPLSFVLPSATPPSLRGGSLLSLLRQADTLPARTIAMHTARPRAFEWRARIRPME